MPTRRIIRLWRAWPAMHPWRGALTLMVFAAFASYTLGAVLLERVVTQLPTPTRISTLIPAFCGIAIGIACQESLTHLPESRKTRLGRFIWVGVVATAGCLAALPVTLTQVSPSTLNALPDLGTTDPGALVRNVLIYGSLALSVTWLGHGHVAWCPPVVLALVALQFGTSLISGDNIAYWWAITRDTHATSAQLMIASLMFFASATAYVIRPCLRRASGY